MQIYYQSDHFYLRELNTSDAQGIFDLDTDPKVMTYLGGVTMTSIKKAETVLKDIMWQYQEFGTGRLAIIDKASEEFIGWTGIKRERGLRDFPYYDLGYRLKSKFWGKGIATETALFSLEHGFTTLKLQEICAATDMAHKASQRVLLKVGLEPSGTFFYEGEDHNWYVITKEKWERKKYN